MNSNTPNLFHYATKELAQDAALAYILAWAQPVFRESYPRLHELGTALLRALLATKPCTTDVTTVTSLDVETQADRIDLLARINDENEEGLVLLVEDKLRTHEHSDQVSRYSEKARKRYPNREIVPVYVKTGNVSRHILPPEEKCGRFLRRGLLDVLGWFPDTGNIIVDNFRANLQERENETNSYRHESPSKWKGAAVEGFYTELQDRMEKEDKRDSVKWDYAANAAGGLRWYVFAENTMVQKSHEFTMYLQIEDATRLTVRLGEGNGPGIRAPIMHEVLEPLEDTVRQADDIRIKKAGRFRGGDTAAVAEVTFGDENSYLALMEGGIVDMDATMQRLVRAREFVSKVASLYPD